GRGRFVRRLTLILQAAHRRLASLNDGAEGESGDQEENAAGGEESVAAPRPLDRRNVSRFRCRLNARNREVRLIPIAEGTDLRAGVDRAVTTNAASPLGHPARYCATLVPSMDEADSAVLPDCDCIFGNG